MFTFQLEKVYGTAVSERCTQVIADVHQFEVTYVCDVNSGSEIVVPLFKDDKIIGNLRYRCPITDRFDDNDKEHLEAIVKIIESNSHKRTSAFSIKC